jgi:hypothetical protein
MAKPADIEITAAHRFFSADCFNRAWDLIDKSERSPEEDELMLELCLSSIWHWRQREDFNATNLSIGYWQAARIFTVLNQLENARRYGMMCLETSRAEGAPPFYCGYAYEALARIESKAGNPGKAKEYIQLARRMAAQVTDLQEKQQLEDDLDTIS